MYQNKSKKMEENYDDWLSSYILQSEEEPLENILYEFTIDSALGEENLPEDLAQALIELPRKKSENSILCLNANTIECHIRKKIALLFASENIHNIYSSSETNNRETDNTTYRLLSLIKTSINSIINNNESSQLLRDDLLKMTFKCIGLIEDYLFSVEKTKHREKLFKKRDNVQQILRLTYPYLAAIAMNCLSSASSHAIIAANSSNKINIFALTVGISQKIDRAESSDIWQNNYRRINEDSIVSDNYQKLSFVNSIPHEQKALATDRDIIIGVWWTYWSMKRLRDNLASSQEVSFLWEVLTERTHKNKKWLQNIQERCIEGHQPDLIRMVALPKSNGGIRSVPLISLEDKVALMALYSACYEDMHRNDRISSDYSYKYPCPDKFLSASSLNYVPRAFWYRYLNNYLKYANSIDRCLDSGNFVIQTDIASFVHCIRPDLLLDSMRMQGYDPAISQAIFQFHSAWNRQCDTIGVPFGNSLTTAGMKIILARISMEMKLKGCESDNFFHYADDFALVGNSLQHAEFLLEVFDEVLADLGFRRNDEKTHIRAPGDPPPHLSVETAIDQAYAEMSVQPYLKMGRDLGTENISFDAPESLAVGGQAEPAIDFNIKLATVPSAVLRFIYLRHIRPYMKQKKLPSKSVAAYTVYRMIQCDMLEAKDAFLHLYQLCPHEQAKMLSWLGQSRRLGCELLRELAIYYKRADLEEFAWLDYSRSRYVHSICEFYSVGSSVQSRDLDALLASWWIDPETGYLTRRELDYFMRIKSSH